MKTENKTAEEILKEVCKYKPEDKLELSDDITAEEALEAIKIFTQHREKKAFEAGRKVNKEYDPGMDEIDYYEHHDYEDYSKENPLK